MSHMKKRIENDVKDAFDGLCPDDFDRILSGCENTKGSMIMTENTNRTTGRRTLRAVLIAAAAVILAAALALGGFFMLRKPNEPGGQTEGPAVTGQEKQTPDNTPETTTVKEPTVPDKTTAAQEPTPTSVTTVSSEPAATVYLDVNPSVEIALDAEKTVLSVKGCNDDGEKLLIGNELAGKQADEALEALIGQLLNKGYLTSEQNALLLSVRTDDKALEKELSKSLETTAIDALTDTLPEGRVVVQSVDYAERFKELNTKYGCNPGKARCILTVLDLTDEYSMDELIGYSFTKLLHIVESLGYPAGGELTDREMINIVVDRFKEEYLPDGIIKETVGNDRKIWHSVYVVTENGEEFANYEYVGGGKVGHHEDGEQWTEFRFAIRYKGMVYDYDVNPITGAVNCKTVYHAALSWEEARALAAAACGRTEADILTHDIETSIKNERFTVYLLFEGENGYEAYRVQIDNRTGSVCDCRPASASIFSNYLLRLANDDLHTVLPDKDLMGCYGKSINLRYMRFTGQFPGGFYHFILDVENNVIVYSEISESETPSEAFEEQVKNCL